MFHWLTTCQSTLTLVGVGSRDEVGGSEIAVGGSAGCPVAEAVAAGDESTDPGSAPPPHDAESKARPSKRGNA